MSGLDLARYYLALVILVSVPGAVLFWFPIHPFAAFWRRTGAGLAYVVGFGVMIVVGVLLFLFRGPLLAVDFGASRVTAGAGVVLLVAAAVIRQYWRKQLTISILFGLPELAPDRYPPKLLTEGIYARVRHPRYLEFSLGGLAASLFCNYLGAYVATLLTIAGLAVLVPFEERELAARFGDDFREYRRRVPAIFPKVRRTGDGR